MHILYSLKTRIALATAMIVVVTALSVIAFLQIRVEEKLNQEQGFAAKSILNTLLLNIESSHRNIEFHEKAIIKERKQQLENVVGLGIGIVERWYNKYQSGQISKLTAQKEALAELKSFRYQNNVGYIWINDTIEPYPKMIMHPTIPELDGKILDAPEFNCAQGTKKNLFRAFVHVTRKSGSGYVDYFWPKPNEPDTSKRLPKLSFVKRFDPWGWILGSGIYMDDIEESVKDRLKVEIELLRNTIKKTRIMNSGYAFIFDETNNLIAHPAYHTDEVSKIMNPKTGNNILDDLKGAVDSVDGKMEYVWDKPEAKGQFEFEKTAYVSEYKPLGWYIGVSFYKDDVQMPIKEMRRQTVLLSVLVLVGAILLSLVFASNLIRPLKRIIEISSKGAKGDYSERLNFCRKDEMGLLAQNFDDFMDEIEGARDSLSVSEKRFRTLFENAVDAQLLIGNHKVLSANTAAVELMNCSNESELYLKSILDFSSEIQNNGTESDELFQNHLDELKNIGFVQFEWDMVKKDGDTFVALIQMTLISEVIHVRLRNITEEKKIHLEKKKTEEQLLQMQKMETIGTLAGGFAHDFNNILSGIVGTLSLMRYLYEEDGEISKTELNEYLHTMETSSERAGKMVSQLLTLSRKKDTEIHSVDLKELINNVVDIAKGSFDKSVQISLELPKEPALINADASQIEQVTLNFCVNGAHAMTIMRENAEQWGGELGIKLTSVLADEEFCAIHSEATVGEYWCLSINDTGVGMSKTTISKIFTPFYTTKDKGVGTGLGLSMVYNIVNEHSGFIYVYSEIGKGSSFSIYLPKVTNGDVALENNSTDNIAKGSGTVLIIDDEELMRKISSRMLINCGYDVLLAEDGRQGVEMYRENQSDISLVLLDMAMPGLSGKETFILLKEFDDSVKVLLASGFKQDDRVKEILTLGVKGFIQKPFDISELSKSVQKLLKNDESKS